MSNRSAIESCPPNWSHEHGSHRHTCARPIVLLRGNCAVTAIAAVLLTVMLIGWTLGVVRAVLAVPGVTLTVMAILLVLTRCRGML